MQTGDRTGKQTYVEAVLSEAEAIKKSYRPVTLNLKSDSLLQKRIDERNNKIAEMRYANELRRSPGDNTNVRHLEPPSLLENNPVFSAYSPNAIAMK